MGVRVTGISAVFHGFSVEKNLQVPVTIPFSIKLGFVEFYKKGEWKNGGSSGGDFSGFVQYQS